MGKLRRFLAAGTLLATGLFRVGLCDAQTAAPTTDITRPPSPPTLLDPNVRPIDLNTALRLAGVQNPQLMIARQRVVEAAALRQLAAVQILPSINLGTNYDSHTGPLQQSNGNILSVNRSALYVGAGSGAVAAGTVSVPGVVLEGNVAVGVYRLSDLAAGRRPAAVRHGGDPEPDVPPDHAGLLRAAPRRRPSRRRAAGPRRGEAGRRSDGRVRQRGPGPPGRRPPGADRAGGPRERRPGGRGGDPHGLGPALLRPEPRPVDPAPPDRRLRGAPSDRARPDPRLRADRPGPAPAPRAEGAPGGDPRGVPGPRRGEGPAVLAHDPDRLQLGRIRRRQQPRPARLRRVRRPVRLRRHGLLDAPEPRRRQRLADQPGQGPAGRDAGTRRSRSSTRSGPRWRRPTPRRTPRFAQIGTSERAVRSGTRGFREDLLRIENTVAPAIETVDSLRLLARARYAYLDSIVDYDRAQFELFVALGQPPADALAHPVPTAGVTPPGEPMTVDARSPRSAPSRRSSGATAGPERAHGQPADPPLSSPPAALRRDRRSTGRRGAGRSTEGRGRWR